MDFSIIINKQANFYFFIQNLSGWHFSCRKRHNKKIKNSFPFGMALPKILFKRLTKNKDVVGLCKDKICLVSLKKEQKQNEKKMF